MSTMAPMYWGVKSASTTPCNLISSIINIWTCCYKLQPSTSKMYCYCNVQNTKYFQEIYKFRTKTVLKVVWSFLSLQLFFQQAFSCLGCVKQNLASFFGSFTAVSSSFHLNPVFTFEKSFFSQSLSFCDVLATIKLSSFHNLRTTYQFINCKRVDHRFFVTYVSKLKATIWMLWEINVCRLDSIGTQIPWMYHGFSVLGTTITSPLSVCNAFGNNCVKRIQTLLAKGVINNTRLPNFTMN